jgi:hypothetical protein
MTGFSHDDEAPYAVHKQAKELASTCWSCGTKHDMVSAVGRKGFKAKTPKAGDITMCIKCGEWNTFEPDLVLRKPTDNEYVDIAMDPGCMRLRWAWVQASIQRGDLPTSKGGASRSKHEQGTKGERK